jgi:molybdopterin synthase catalytic subunit/molybdopterin synthase sulfur carrier subunit
MRVRALFFAGAREIVGAAELTVDLAEGCTARGFVDALCAQYAALDAHRSSLRVAIDGAYAGWDDVIADGAEVAVIPPVAGG